MSRDRQEIVFRDFLTEKDIPAIKDLVRSTEVFNACELKIAEELAWETYAKGVEASGYHFILAEIEGRLIGYACFGPISCTENRFDLYWIAVQKNEQHSGIGKRLLAKTEQKITELGGVKIYVDTSSLGLYESARGFYQKHGYRPETVIKDFHKEGDDKIIFAKDLRHWRKTQGE
jgi:N-acetylglutamate synthase-like GNAT family acetyltransferase